MPGPICYGRGGTEPTVSDANLLLGYLNPDDFCGWLDRAVTTERRAELRDVFGECADSSRRAAPGHRGGGPV